MSFNYDALRGKIREKYGTIERFASDMGMSNKTISYKLNGHSQFQADEIKTACVLLGISARNIPAYFFAE